MQHSQQIKQTMNREERNSVDLFFADYMGLEYIPREKSHGDWGWWKKGTFKQGKSVNNTNFICITDTEINYCKDWNKLHDVWDKFKIVKIEQSNSEILSFELNSKIDSLSYKLSWYNIDEFALDLAESIKWYQQINK